ncbi:MAG: aspartate kinase [Candidatus Bathyarchaeota archaeon]|nr:aspartate kinase [Candidatus Bathyarchaeum sp.]
MRNIGTLSVAKFGGSLLSRVGENIPSILEHVADLKSQNDFGPIVVFSAPNGFTDKLIAIGESYTLSEPLSVDSIFGVYESLAKNFVKGEYLQQALAELSEYRRQLEDTTSLINKRFHGTVKAKFLTHGGELPTSVLMSYIMKSNGLDSCHVAKDEWPIITDDNFENSTPNLDLSKKRTDDVINSLEAGKVVVLGGFLGITNDGLETILGRGGSDLSAVFVSCLLKRKFQVETVLFKELPIQSADPNMVKGQVTEQLTSLTYNEAHKASKMGMKIVQGDAISMAKQFGQQIKVMSMVKPEEFTMIHPESDDNQTVKCVTGKKGCAILSMDDTFSRSFEDALRIWENCNDFLDLGTETLETGKRIRDFLFLDSEFLRKNEERLKGFDEELTIEYNVGVVTLIGDGMKYSSGVASIAIGAIPHINIKRGIFAPHTSQIILLVDENQVAATVAAIHAKRPEMNKTP